MNTNQHKFVCEMLRHGDKQRAYRAAYDPTSNNARSIESAANRLMKNEEVAAAIEEAQDRMFAEAAEALKDRYIAEMLTVQRKRELLAQIAEGKWIEQSPPDHITGHPVAVMIPTLKDRLKAIDMDNRMDGSYQAKPASAEATAGEENTDEVTSPENIERNRTQRVNKPLTGAVYITVKGNKVQKPEIRPKIIPPHPSLNKAPDIFQHNKTQPAFAEATAGNAFFAEATAGEDRPGWMRTVQL